MTTTNISDTTSSNFVTPGLAKGLDPESLGQLELKLSDVPPLFTDDFVIKAGQKFDLYQVVAFEDATNRKIVIAEYNANPTINTKTTPIGIIAAPIDLSASGASDGKAQVYLGGNFNGDMLVWHSSFTGTKADSDNPTAAELKIDDDRRRNAFRAAPAPTQIVIGFNPNNRLRNL